MEEEEKYWTVREIYVTEGKILDREENYRTERVNR